MDKNEWEADMYFEEIVGFIKKKQSDPVPNQLLFLTEVIRLATHALLWGSENRVMAMGWCMESVSRSIEDIRRLDDEGEESFDKDR